MKPCFRIFFIMMAVGMIFLAFNTGKIDVLALGQPGKVNVTDREPSAPVDLEYPETIVDPGPSPSTKGALRIDFISSLDFGIASIQSKDRNYKALAQNFIGETGPRGSYVQISDRREIKSGWSLQVKQKMQFRNESIPNDDEKELTGAVLSLDRGWANSITGNPAPNVTRNTVSLKNIGQTYEVATSTENSGKGIWTIAFGASQKNEHGQKNTLTPLFDQNGKAIVDQTFNKLAYTNSAITLSIPHSTNIYPVEYQTELTWILSEFP